MDTTFIKTNEYNGRYVAMKSFEDHAVIGVGADPETAINEALKKGYKDPVLLYIPEQEMVHIY